MALSTPDMTPDASSVVLRAYRFTLDPSPTQLQQLAGHAGAARWAFNHALAQKVVAHEQWRSEVNALVEAGVPESDARRQIALPIPTKVTIQKAWNQSKGDDRRGVDGVSPWWHEYSTYAFQSAFEDADHAWRNWMDSLRGQRAGQRVGYPRFKKKNRSRASFRLHHNVNRPTIRPDPGSYRRLRMPRIGSVRVHDSTKRLVRALNAGGRIQSVTVSQSGHRWYASVLVKFSASQRPKSPTHRQRAAGRIGVKIGIRSLATLSDGTTVANPQHLAHAMDRLAAAQRAFARTQNGSNRRERAAMRVRRLHHVVAERRTGYLHQVTKKLATTYAEIALPNLDLRVMTRSPKRRRGKGELNVAPRTTSASNRALLDVAPGQFRQQLAYKTGWYGSTLLLCERGLPTNRTCSTCGATRPKSLRSTVFYCDACGMTLNRDLNSARVIARAAGMVAVTPLQQHRATVALDTRETENARRGSVKPGNSRSQRQAGPAKREGPEEVTPAE